jgi:hypothetical protein
MSYFGSYPKEDNHKPTPKVNEAPQRQARKLVAPPGGQSKFSLAWDEPEP